MSATRRASFAPALEIKANLQAVEPLPPTPTGRPGAEHESLSQVDAVIRLAGLAPEACGPLRAVTRLRFAQGSVACYGMRCARASSAARS